MEGNNNLFEISITYDEEANLSSFVRCCAVIALTLDEKTIYFHTISIFCVEIQPMQPHTTNENLNYVRARLPQEKMKEKKAKSFTFCDYSFFPFSLDAVILNCSAFKMSAIHLQCHHRHAP